MGPRSLSHISGIQLSGVEKIKLAVIYEKNENFYIHSSRLMLNVCMQYIYIYMISMIGYIEMKFNL